MTGRREVLRGMGGFGFLAAGAGAAPGPQAGASGLYPVREFGARGDGTALETRAIQAAVDRCGTAGGGRVYFEPGCYLSGTIVMRSGVTLYLEAGATLLGSKALSDYPEKIPAFRSFTDTYTDKSLIYAEGLRNIGIAGRGTIDGQGAAFRGPYKVRPYLIRVIECANVLVEDVEMRDSPMWVQHYLACDDVVLRGLRVHSRVNRNNDGIDIDCCRRVRISDCDISSGDDAIVLKSTAGRSCKDVAVVNCVLSTDCNALKMGTESNGGFENIAMSNCTIYDTVAVGIAVEMVDGGLLDRVTVSGVVMNNVGTPIFVRLGDRGRPYQKGQARFGVGRLRNVLISGVQATGAGQYGCSITGLPGHPVENVSIDNVRIAFVGGGTAEDAAREPAENPGGYPDFRMFGVLPAYGFFCRHARNLSLRNVETCLESPDARPALICEDVQDLKMAAADFAAGHGIEPIRLRNVRQKP